MQKTCVQSLGREDPLEKATATHSSLLAWEIPWTEEPGRLQPMGSERVGRDLVIDNNNKSLGLGESENWLLTHKAHGSATVDELGVSIYKTGAIF